MSILSNNPTGLYDVTREWECWEWSWNNEKEMLVRRETKFMEALGEDWEYWMKELLYIPTIAPHYEYCTKEQLNRCITALKKLCRILWEASGHMSGQVRPFSNPQHPVDCTPEYQIHFDGEPKQSFIFRTNNQDGRTGRAHYKIEDIVPGFTNRINSHISHFGGPHIPYEIKWDANGNTTNLWEY